MSEPGIRLVEARRRAAAAKARELAAHRRAIDLHEAAAAHHDRFGHHAEAKRERDRAAIVRARLVDAIGERDRSSGQG